jgi:hypothetical protein
MLIAAGSIGTPSSSAVYRNLPGKLMLRRSVA